MRADLRTISLYGAIGGGPKILFDRLRRHMPYDYFASDSGFRRCDGVDLVVV